MTDHPPLRRKSRQQHEVETIRLTRNGVASGQAMISAEELVGEEWAEWYSMTPMERWSESAKLWEVYLAMGGSLDPEPDTQSPFFDPEAPTSFPVDQPQLRLVRRNGVRTFEWATDLNGA